MTIQGAMQELINLLDADDIPIYYKGGIQKVIETIDDYIDGKDDYVKRRAEQTEPQCEKCKHFREEAEMYTHQCEFYFMECRYEPKDEPNYSEKPNNCEDLQDWKDRMWTEAIVTEPKSCKTCKHDSNKWYELPCETCCGYRHYEPKDKPQTERSE